MNEQLSSPIESKSAGTNATALACALVVIAAIIERAWLHFSTPLVPGINGAYYLVQTRALIESGKLGITDLPLTFWIDAGIAKLLHLLSHASLESCILLAVKLEDSILPSLAAVPVFVLVRRWALRAGAGLWLPIGAALAVACGGPALTMVGDFQKNSLGLVWLAALLCQLHRWFEMPTAKNAALSVFLLGLVGLTHIGVFGWVLVLAGLATTIYLWLGDISIRRKMIPWLLVGVAACGLAAGLVLWKYDPARVHRLATAIAHPLAFIGNEHGKQPANQFPPPPFGQTSAADPRPPGPGPAGGPGGSPMFGRLNYAAGSLFLLVGASAIGALWLRRKTLSPGDIAVVGASALTVMALGGPWVTGDKVQRFGLIAVIPAVIASAFALTQLRWSKTRNALMALIAIAMVGTGALRLPGGGRPTITLASAAELNSLHSIITSPQKTLVVARHGLEWWTAWYLHTHIAHVDALKPDDWQKFDQVFFLRQNAGMQMPFGPPPSGDQFPPGGPGDGFGPGGAPDGNGPPPMGPPAGGRGAMAETEIPPDADVRHDGEYFTFALVKPSDLPEGFY